MKCFLFVVVLSLVALINVARAELVSGPGAEKKLDALKVFVATGDQASKEVEFIAERKEKPTVYIVVPAEKFSRPMARFIKTLDEKLNAERTDIDIIVVWLTDDVAKTKETEVMEE